MKAKELLRRYDNGSMDAVNGGMLFDVTNSIKSIKLYSNSLISYTFR